MCKTTSKVRCTRASFYMYIHSKLQKRKRKLCLFSFSYIYFIISNSNYFIHRIAQKKAFRKLLYIFEKMILDFFYTLHLKYINIKLSYKRFQKKRFRFII